jgi:HSP20 family protein
MSERPLSTMLRDFDRFFSLPWLSPETEWAATAQYPVDVYEIDDRIAVDAEMPGFKPEDIDVSLERGVLSISAERKAEEEGRGPRHLSERRFTRVERSFSLPSDVDPSKAEAKLEDGVLHIELPKTEESKQQKIKVM